jgi:RIO kinase 1
MAHPMGIGLEHLLAEGVISEVLGRLKSGKEADVFVVRFGGKVVAAKVYKDRAQRSFKNNSAYKEGRSVRSSRSQRAIDKKSSFGQAAAEEAWKSSEADALYKLHAAGVRVPSPVVFLDGVLLMELVLDANGEAAPRLMDTDLTIDDANAAYKDMLGQLVRILACDLIHGDLSPYNVLWGAAGPTIIDFPQTLSASHNSNSEMFFLRDARNILGYFAGIDHSLHARSGDPAEIWRAYVRRELTPDFLPMGRPAPPPPRPRAAPPPPREHHAPRMQPHAHRPPAPARPPVPPRAPHAPAHAPAPAHRAAPHAPRPSTPATHTPRTSPPATHPHDRSRRDGRRAPPAPEVFVRSHRGSQVSQAPLANPSPPREERAVAAPPAAAPPHDPNAPKPSRRRRRRRRN